MIKLKLFIGAIFLSIIFSGCCFAKEKTIIDNQKNTQIKGLPPDNFGRGKLKRMLKYDPESRDLFAPDLRSYDLSELDLSNNLTDLLHSTFNTQTKWPEVLPKGFDPEKIMEINKNPGLKIRKLHEEGITGKGVSIAIIDQGLLTGHDEYAQNLKMYDSVHCLDKTAAMHGSAVSSIAVGKNCGVAPDANLYYIACTTGSFENGKFNFDMSYFAKAVDKIIELNKTLPEKDKIRVISASTGWIDSFKGSKEADAAVERARKENIFVVVSLEPFLKHYGYKFNGLGKNAYTNPDDLCSFSPVSCLLQKRLLSAENLKIKDKLYFPMDSKTLASFVGTHDYVYDRNGGISWIIPYISGLYVLACQVDPQITPDKFWKTALATGSYMNYNDNGKMIKFGKIINPVKLIHTLENEK